MSTPDGPAPYYGIYGHGGRWGSLDAQWDETWPCPRSAPVAGPSPITMRSVATIALGMTGQQT